MNPPEKYGTPSPEQRAEKPPVMPATPPFSPASRSIMHAAAAQESHVAMLPDGTPTPLTGQSAVLENLQSDDLPTRLKRRYREEASPRRRWQRVILGGIVVILLVPLLIFGLGALRQPHNPSPAKALSATATPVATALAEVTLTAGVSAMSTATLATPGAAPATVVSGAGGHPTTPTVAASMPTATPIVTGGLVAYWRFDEGSGMVAHDSSGGDNTGTLVGNVAWGAGHNNGGLGFNGSNGEVDTNQGVVNVNGDYTVAAWVQLSTATKFGTIISQDAATVSPFYLQYISPGWRGSGDLDGSISDQFVFSFCTGDNDNNTVIRVAGPDHPSPNTWYYLVGVRDSIHQQIRLYINGTLAGATTTPNTTWNTVGPTTIGIGKWNGAHSDSWSGAIDEVRLYNRALSSQEIQALSVA